jgi:hypothetical protein
MSVLTPTEIFLLGWNAYRSKQEMVRLLDCMGGFDHARLTPPTQDEIIALIRENAPVKNDELGEHSIG